MPHLFVPEVPVPALAGKARGVAAEREKKATKAVAGEKCIFSAGTGARFVEEVILLLWLKWCCLLLLLSCHLA